MGRQTCSVPDCAKPNVARMLCNTHYRQASRAGHLDDYPTRPIAPKKPKSGVVRRPAGVPIREWILARIERTDAGCWEWLGPRQSEGYGHIGIDGRNRYVHRVSYEDFVGNIPDGWVIDHLCRNRICCNPDHLEAVTHGVNILRGMAPTAIAVRVNRCKRGHEFTSDNTYFRPDGKGRQCRECIRLRSSRSKG